MTMMYFGWCQVAIVVPTQWRNNSLTHSQQPISGGIPVELKAGAGVVYTHIILHWGSNYSRKLRRTVHGGFSPFALRDGDPFTQYLNPNVQEVFHRWEAQSRRKQDLTEAALRAALSADAIGYDMALDGLRPGVGSKGKLLQTVFLTKAAFFIRLHKRPDLLANVSERIARASVSSHSICLLYTSDAADE